MAPQRTEKQISMDDSREAFLAERASKVTAAAERAAHAQRYLANTVRNARDAGLSWAAIGELLGVSRQAAQQRFGQPEATD